ncbi:MAG: hypothetical protein AAFQ82_06780 [Myxococcota bacterium]
MTLRALVLLTLTFFGCHSTSGEPKLAEPSRRLTPLSNEIRWVFASELNVFGFHVYRSIDASGPFERVTEDVIRAASGLEAPRAYEFVDHSIEPGIPYYYFVESLTLDGQAKRVTPIVSAPPKPGPGSEGAD